MRTKKAKLLSLPQRFALSLTLLALIWLALRNTAIALFAGSQPFAALVFWPRSGAAVAASGRLATQPEEQRRIAIEALSRDPLSSRSLLLAARSRLGEEGRELPIALLEEAVRRNSRDGGSRGELLQLYLAEGRWSEAIDEGVALSRLRSSTHNAVMEVFLLLVRDVRAGAVLARKLENRADGSPPPWRYTLIKMAAGRPGEAEFMAMMKSAASSDGQVSAAPAELSADGYLAWVKALPADAIASVRPVFDGEFRGLSGPPPYGWLFANEERGAATVQKEGKAGGVLFARASGTQARELARQVLVLPPGRHRLRVEASASPRGRMSWRLQCVSGTPLAEVPIVRAEAPRPAQRQFTVPPNCRFQTLSLVGAADVAAGQARSSTERIMVHPVL